MSEERTTRRYTRLSEEEWAQAEEAWSTGEFTLEDLADTFDVSVRSLQNRFSARGIMKGAPVEGFTIAMPELPASIDIADTLAQAVDVRSRTVGAARELHAQLMASTRALALDRTTRPAATVRTLVAAAAALERLHEIERKALGLDGTEHLSRELPNLVLRDITDAEIADIQEGRLGVDEDEAAAGPMH